MDSYLTLIPVSAVIATADRVFSLKKTLWSLLGQSVLPNQIIVVDSSNSFLTRDLCELFPVKIVWIHSEIRGAAAQRELGLKSVKNDFVLFMDDDIIMENDCLINLWSSINNKENIVGGVSAMITNQNFREPSVLTRWLYDFMSETKFENYSGKCIGPAWNLLPSDSPTQPILQTVDWLNSTCTLYRKMALPKPLFSDIFNGYSFLEDLSLSLRVRKNWLLLNCRAARIYHDSQLGMHKSNIVMLAEMMMFNRYYVMKYDLNQNGYRYFMKLLLLESFWIIGELRQISGWKKLPFILLGKCRAIFKIIKT